MINGIIKLFYSEIVKSKMKSMPSKEYDIRDEFKDISNIAMKVDSFFLVAFKLIIGLTIIVISLSINILFGVGSTLILILYGISKLHIANQITDQVKDGMENIKINLESSSQSVVTDKIKQNINALVCLLFIGIFSNFNYIIIGCFIIVFMFTIKDIYSNINK
ncbi:hypothetical protein [Paraclostridium bifermentans]|uniref:hypothetical protein n=1 Tax=Paraclostridium bifermentans TaxID=1490 RepID=UPI001C80D925|nr:hypothetical protein [Paraclostridium bifermentans]GIM32025.1 hypothetical protein PAGU1678_12950 [Paraclostridium bifermentans subsp. muricolitidis]